MIKRILTSLFVLSLSNNVMAGCDTCVQSLVESYTKTMEASVKSANSSLDAVNESVDALNNAISQMNNTLTASPLGTIPYSTQQIQKSLSGLQKMILGGIDKEIKLTSNQVEALTDFFTQITKEVLATEMQFEVSMDSKQPSSLDVSAMRSAYLRIALEKRDDLIDILAKKSWINDPKLSGAQAMYGSLLEQSKASDDFWSPINLISKTELTKDESIQAQNLIAVLTLPPVEPELNEKDDVSRNSAAREYYKNINKAKLEMIRGVLAKQVADKHPLIPISTEDWKQAYVIADSDEDNLTSVQGYIESEIIGRMVSEEWSTEISKLPTAAVLRERVQIQNVNNFLLYQLIEQEEAKLLMQSMLAADELNALRPRLPVDISVNTSL